MHFTYKINAKNIIQSYMNYYESAKNKLMPLDLIREIKAMSMK